MYVTLDKSLNFFGGNSLKDIFDTHCLEPCDPSVVNLPKPLNFRYSNTYNQILIIFKVSDYFSNLKVHWCYLRSNFD